MQNNGTVCSYEETAGEFRKRHRESSSIGHGEGVLELKFKVLQAFRARYEISQRNTVQEIGRTANYLQPRVPAGIGSSIELRQQIGDSLRA